MKSLTAVFALSMRAGGLCRCFGSEGVGCVMRDAVKY